MELHNHGATQVLIGMGGQGPIPLPILPRKRPTNTVVVIPGHATIILVTIAMVKKVNIFPIRKIVGTSHDLIMPQAVGMLISSNISATVGHQGAIDHHLLMDQVICM